MLPVDKIRSSPNQGRYLFHNSALRLAMGAIDSTLGFLRSPSHSSLSIDPSKILVCNQAHIGDVIWASSVLVVLNAAFPQAKIGFLTHPASTVVLSENPRVEWLHSFEHVTLNRQNISFLRKLKSHVHTRSRAMREIKAVGYDLAIDLYPYFPNSIPLLFAAGIPARLGWTSGGFGALLTHALDWQYAHEHVVEWHKKLIDMIQPCRAHTALARPELYSSEQIREQWEKIAREHGIPRGYVALHVGSGGVHRRWPKENWKYLAKLCLESGWSIVLLGYGEDEERACGDIAAVSTAITDLSGKLSWPLMAEAIGRSALLVGLESASSHIAAARDVPSVSIYTGISHPTVFRPFHPMSRVVIHPTACSPCHLSRGCEGMECVRLTSPQTVFSEIQSLMEALSPPSQLAAKS
jgi:ADP-heptose:LPS heptosyltransferase